MKPQTRLFTAGGLLLLALGIAWFTFSTRNQIPPQVFPATVNRDCAPWDGTAFVVSIQYDPKTTITISIWKAPDFHFPVTFSFPNETGRVGFAHLLSETESRQPLIGKVYFLRVGTNKPVAGRFELATETGSQFKGQFKAGWGNEIVYCG